MRITSGVNAGLFIETRDTSVWLDALHNEKIAGFSSVTHERYRRIMNNPDISNPDILLYTHVHPDHCSPDLNGDVMSRWDGVLIAAPERIVWEQIILCKPKQSIVIKGTKIISFPLPHAKPSKPCVHYGFWIGDGEQSILLLGDCEISAPELEGMVENMPCPDCVVVPFLWITSVRGQTFLKKYFPEAKLIINHLPFPEDDQYHYRNALNKALVKISNPYWIASELFAVDII